MSGKSTETIRAKARLIEDGDDVLESSLAMIIHGISEYECNFRRRNAATRIAMDELLDRIDSLTVEREELLQQNADLSAQIELQKGSK